MSSARSYFSVEAAPTFLRQCCAILYLHFSCCPGRDVIETSFPTHDCTCGRVMFGHCQHTLTSLKNTNFPCVGASGSTYTFNYDRSCVSFFNSRACTVYQLLHFGGGEGGGGEFAPQSARYVLCICMYPYTECP